MTGSRSVSAHLEQWPARHPFRIAGLARDSFVALAVEIGDGDHVGRGEALPVHYLGESVERMLAQVAAVADRLRSGLDRRGLLAAMPAGAARKAVDAALWDLEAKAGGKRVWELLDIAPRPLPTIVTIGIEADAEAMARRALDWRDYASLKVKVDADDPVERVAAIRAARPDAVLLVDANQAWTLRELESFAPALAVLGVVLIEQPLARGADESLAGYRSPVPLCADESCQDMSELDALVGRYDAVNIKLEKCGGLTEGLRIAERARALGLGLQAGNMCGTSLAMAPCFVLAQLCDFVELDGPLLLANDRIPGFRFEGGAIAVPPAALWG